MRESLDERPDLRAYAAGLAMHGNAASWFAGLAARTLQRFLRQNGQPELGRVPLAAITAGLWEVAEMAGFPEPLAEGAARGPQERSIEPSEPVLAHLASLADPEARGLVLSGLRQLLKACVYGEFTECRDSYRQVNGAGVCKRQLPATARGRLCGSPCVDCPYYVLLSPAEHERRLREHWAKGNEMAFADGPDCFLPADFRELRRFLWLHGRGRLR